jgi:serine/threonine protein kinase
LPLSDHRWHVITPSEFPWEREALEYLRERLPDREPFHAWTNFQFIADDGSINEVDLLLLAPSGLFLVEIKSAPGQLRGDAGTWTWQTPEGRLKTVDNPLLLADKKAKRLKSLLERQKAIPRGSMPFLRATIFASASNLTCHLDATARTGLLVRDERAQGPNAPPGVIARLTRPPERAGLYDRGVIRAVQQAIDQAGIRPSLSANRVGDYRLEKLLLEGPGYQDWEGVHVALKHTRRRVRLYPLARATSASQKETLRRAAEREFKILEGLDHPGILKAVHFAEGERGPALIFEHEQDALRLDHHLRLNGAKLGLDARLALLRQVAEALHYAHQHRLYHRGLGPQSVSVFGPDSPSPRLRLFNWQTARRDDTGGGAPSATTHLGHLVDDQALLFLAPEALTDPAADPALLDVFSLGCLAAYLFAGMPPATSPVELSEKLRRDNGVRLSGLADGVLSPIEELILWATRPLVTSRLDSVEMFLRGLDDIEEELTRPDPVETLDPLEAKAGDVLGPASAPTRFKVKRRLGTGATSLALLVDDQGDEAVLKVARDHEHNDRLRSEGEVLVKLRHQHICALRETLDLGGRTALLMDKAGDRTLAQRLREDGPLHLDLLQRFGEDLLQTVDWLEQQGVAHRDIKPENIGVTPVGRGDRLHLVLFDFSLARTPADNIRAGTAPYLDPFLSLRKPPRWDLHAERFAAAMTLYEMATGTLPRWGDGRSDPSMLKDEAAIEADRFDPELREALAGFFTRALRRDWTQRFGNALEMLNAWRRGFDGLDAAAPAAVSTAPRHPESAAPGAAPSPPPSPIAERAQFEQNAATATPDTSLALIGLGTRAINALERVRVTKVGDLLRLPLPSVHHMRGVGAKTRREIVTLVDVLAARFPEAARGTTSPPPVDGDETLPTDRSLDALCAALIPKQKRADGVAEQKALRLLLGLDSADALPAWPAQTEVSRHLEVTRARVGQIVTKARKRWQNMPPLAALGDEVADWLVAQGGAASPRELSTALLALRTAQRAEHAAAVARAIVEAEQEAASPRFALSRAHGILLVAQAPSRADYAVRLGVVADGLAKEDPLPSPSRVVEALAAVTPERNGTALAAPRLITLAVAASSRAAISSRLEIYPRGLPAARALSLAQQALLGASELRIDDLRQRVATRYPEAEPLPDRPALDALVRAVGLELEWNDAASAYRLPDRFGASVSGSSTSLPREPTALAPLRPGTMPTPEAAEARAFQARLDHSLARGGFLAFTVDPRHAGRAEAELLERFALKRVSLEARLIEQMKAIAQRAKADWRVVLAADSADHNAADWRNLIRLASQATDTIRDEVVKDEQPLLLVQPGLLGRYDRLDFFAHLRDRAGTAGAVQVAWVLIPSDAQETLPMLDGRAIPVLTPGEWTRIPESWLSNLHRSEGAPAS